MLTHIDLLDQAIGQVQTRIKHPRDPTQEAMTRLLTIAVSGAPSSAAILAEIGGAKSQFPSAKHLASWAGRCPGNKQSGGKQMLAGTNPGKRWLRGTFGEVAWVVSQTKDNDLVAQFRRIARRRGKYGAVIALAHTLLVIIRHILREERPSTDLGADYLDYFDRLETGRLERYPGRHLEPLGYTVTLAPAIA